MLDLSDDEELQQSMDLHSLIVSCTHEEEPLATVDQVISEIEEMMEVNDKRNYTRNLSDSLWTILNCMLANLQPIRLTVSYVGLYACQSSSLSLIGLWIWASVPLTIGYSVYFLLYCYTRV